MSNKREQQKHTFNFTDYYSVSHSAYNIRFIAGFIICRIVKQKQMLSFWKN